VAIRSYAREQSEHLERAWRADSARDRRISSHMSGVCGTLYAIIKENLPPNG